MHDSRVRHKRRADHVKMDGQTVNVNEEFDLGNGVTTMSPGNSGDAANDIHCRCYLSYDLEDMEDAPDLEELEETAVGQNRDKLKETTENREKQRDRQEEGIAKSMGSDTIDVKKEMTSQLGRLTEEEKEVVTRYTGFQAQKVNSAIAAGRVTPADEKYMSVLDSVLEKGVVTKDITVHRKTILEYMNLPFGAKKLIPENVRILLGQTITNNTYTSTSLTDFKYPGRNVFLDLHIPKGYKGACT